jgi:PleD family two-component response regulator
VAQPTPELRFLVVDDHENMRHIVGAVLRGYGFTQIKDCDDGASGLRAIHGFRPDIVITDFAMPEVDGVAFAQQIRAMDDPLRFVPIIMVSGHAHAKMVFAARDAGVNEFLAKPVTGRNLADRIRRIIEEDRVFLTTADYVGPDRRRGQHPDHTGPWRREDDAQKESDAS